MGAPLVSQTIVRPTGRHTSIVVVPPSADGADIRSALELPSPRGLVVLNGGTDDLSPSVRERLSRMVQDGLARVVVEQGLTAVTGGTDAGIFELFGKALGERATGPCIGVAPAGLVEGPANVTPSSEQGRVPLEPHHTHFVLVETDRWGGETKAMLSLVDVLAAGTPSLAVLASGGDVAKQEILAHVRSGREIVVIGGTGRLADEIADAVARPGASQDADIREIASGAVTVIEAEAPPSVLAEVLRKRFATPRRRRSLRNLPLLRPLPRFRWKADPVEGFVPSTKLASYPALEADIQLLDQELVPSFRRLDQESLRAQNSSRLRQLAVILGGTAASALGAVQAALGGGVVALAVPEALLAGLLAGTVVYIKGRDAQREYSTNRLRAERLRSEYFLFVARAGRYAEEDEAGRRRLLRGQVREIESLEVAP